MPVFLSQEVCLKEPVTKIFIGIRITNKTLAEVRKGNNLILGQEHKEALYSMKVLIIKVKLIFKLEQLLVEDSSIDDLFCKIPIVKKVILSEGNCSIIQGFLKERKPQLNR